MDGIVDEEEFVPHPALARPAAGHSSSVASPQEEARDDESVSTPRWGLDRGSFAEEEEEQQEGEEEGLGPEVSTAAQEEEPALPGCATFTLGGPAIVVPRSPERVVAFGDLLSRCEDLERESQLLRDQFVSSAEGPSAHVATAEVADILAELDHVQGKIRNGEIEHAQMQRRVSQLEDSAARLRRGVSRYEQQQQHQQPGRAGGGAGGGAAAAGRWCGLRWPSSGGAAPPGTAAGGLPEPEASPRLAASGGSPMSCGGGGSDCGATPSSQRRTSSGEVVSLMRAVFNDSSSSFNQTATPLSGASETRQTSSASPSQPPTPESEASAAYHAAIQQEEDCRPREAPFPFPPFSFVSRPPNPEGCCCRCDCTPPSGTSFSELAPAPLAPPNLPPLVVANSPCTCPQGHLLQPVLLTMRSQNEWICDACDQRFAAFLLGITRHRCDWCDYDLCGACYAQRVLPQVKMTYHTVARSNQVTSCPASWVPPATPATPPRRNATAPPQPAPSAVGRARSTPREGERSHGPRLLPAAGQHAPTLLLGARKPAAPPAPAPAPAATPPAGTVAMNGQGSSCLETIEQVHVLPINHDSYVWLQNAKALPLMRQQEDLGRAVQYFEEANHMHLLLYGVESPEANYNVACCFSLAAAAAASGAGEEDPSPGLPPLGKSAWTQRARAEARLDLAVLWLRKAVDAGYANVINMATDLDIAALRQARPAQFTGIMQALGQHSSQQAAGSAAALPGPATAGSAAGAGAGGAGGRLRVHRGASCTAAPPQVNLRPLAQGAASVGVPAVIN